MADDVRNRLEAYRRSRELDELKRREALEANKFVLQPTEPSTSYLGSKLTELNDSIDNWTSQHPRLTMAIEIVFWTLAALAAHAIGLIGAFVLIFLFIALLRWGFGKRRRHEPSAYSVFNENCERLTGTFTAEQFEKSMRRGGGMM